MLACCGLFARAGDGRLRFEVGHGRQSARRPLRVDDRLRGDVRPVDRQRHPAGRSKRKTRRAAINGKKIDVITYDDKGEAREAGTAVTRLISRDGVVAVLGEVASGLSLAGAPICQENGVPMVSPSSTNPKVTKTGDMIFRVCFIDPFQGWVGAKFARENEKIKATKAAILYDQASPYSVGLQEEFEKAFTGMGGTIAAKQTYTAGDQDFSAQLTTIRSSEPDVVFIPGYYTDVGNIALQARKLGITVPLLGGDGWDSAKLGQIGGEAINGSFYSNHYSQQDPNPRVQDFIKKYKDKFGETPDGLAALGYDAARILFEAMRRAKSLGGDDDRGRAGDDEGFRRRDRQDLDRRGSQRGQAGRHAGNEGRRADVRDARSSRRSEVRSGGCRRWDERRFAAPPEFDISIHG